MRTREPRGRHNCLCYRNWITATISAKVGLVQPMKGYSVQTSHPASSDDASYFDRAVKWLRLSNLDSRWIRWAFVVGTVLYFVCLAMFETGPINRFSSDVFILLDGGWRILNGQVPHRDFYVALGPLEYMITAGGMLLTHGSPRGIAIGNVVFGITVGFWGWYLSRKRMPAILGLMVTAWLILTAAGVWAAFPVVLPWSCWDF